MRAISSSFCPLAEWEGFVYVGKIAFFDWISHIVPLLVTGLIFSSKRYTQKTKSVAFGVIAGFIILAFWSFKGIAFGIDGPVNDHWGLEWRKMWNI